MERLRDIFNQHTGNLVHKLDHYFEIYESYFSKYVGKDVVILEIGVSHGGSFQMWKTYFGNKAKIYAVDINPECMRLEEENVKIFIGSQEDKTFLLNLIKEIPQPDIIIDDGGHTMKQQITTFELLYGSLKNGGIYLCEDTCTSYWYEYGGGFRKKSNFVEYSKRLIDYLYSSHLRGTSLPANELSKNINSIHFYDSIIVFEKGLRSDAVHVQRGNKTIDHNENPTAGRKTIIHRIIKRIQSR